VFCFRSCVFYLGWAFLLFCFVLSRFPCFESWFIVFVYFYFMFLLFLVFLLSVLVHFVVCVCVHLCFSRSSFSWICVLVGCCVGFVVVVFAHFPHLGTGVVCSVFVFAGCVVRI